MVNSDRRSCPSRRQGDPKAGEQGLELAAVEVHGSVFTPIKRVDFGH